ncbi:MAG: endonuclease/exonuclease/phosphatase family protein, partial [Pirellula sp.]
MIINANHLSLIVLGGLLSTISILPTLSHAQDSQTKTIRVATFNAAMNRKSLGELSRGLEQGDKQASDIAAILRAVSPDIVLINEIDRDEHSEELFLKRYLNTQLAADQT